MQSLTLVAAALVRRLMMSCLVAILVLLEKVLKYSSLLRQQTFSFPKMWGPVMELGKISGLAASYWQWATSWRARQWSETQPQAAMGLG